jgi:hypothetical protein
MDDDKISKAEFLADFFCSSLAKEVYKSLSDVSNNADKLWQEINECQEDDTDY